MKNNTLKYYLLIVLAGFLSGAIVFGGEVFSILGLSLFEISIWTYLIGLAPIFLILFFQKKLALRRDTILIFILYGFLSALTAMGQFSSVILGLPVAIAVLLLYTQPLWTIIYAGIFMKEKVGILEVICCILVLIGVLFLVNPWGSFHISTWLGFFAGLMGGIGLSGWVLTSSAASKKGNEPTNTFFWGSVSLLIFLFIFLPITRFFIDDPAIVRFSTDLPLYLWIYLALFSLLTNVFCHISFFYGVKVVPAVDASLVMLVEPVIGTILAALFLSQAITFSVFIGGMLILIANYLIIRKGSGASELSETLT